MEPCCVPGKECFNNGFCGVRKKNRRRQNEKHAELIAAWAQHEVVAFAEMDEAMQRCRVIVKGPAKTWKCSLRQVERTHLDVRVEGDTVQTLRVYVGGVVFDNYRSNVYDDHLCLTFQLLPGTDFTWLAETPLDASIDDISTESVRCRGCQEPILKEEVDLEVCCLPSQVWDCVMDMAVCEECAPLQQKACAPTPGRLLLGPDGIACHEDVLLVKDGSCGCGALLGSADQLLKHRVSFIVSGEDYLRQYTEETVFADQLAKRCRNERKFKYLFKSPSHGIEVQIIAAELHLSTNGGKQLQRVMKVRFRSSDVPGEACSDTTLECVVASLEKSAAWVPGSWNQVEDLVERMEALSLTPWRAAYLQLSPSW